MADPFVHDIDLEIGRLFGLPVYWYGAVYTIGFLGIFIWFTLRRQRIGLSLADVVELAILAAIGILIGGRVFDILVCELDYYASRPLQALNWWRGGMASHGVMLGGVACISLFSRLRGRPFVLLADELAVPAAFLLGLGRIGNFIEGGVIGSVTTLPWGVVYAHLEGARHPVALYDGAKNLLLVPILVAILRRFEAGRGVAMGSFLFLYAFLRLLIDDFRDYEGGWLGVGQGQYFNVIVMAIGLGTLTWAMCGRPAVTPLTRPERRRVNPLLVALFIVLCLYPLGIPTSWTRANIEEKRLGPNPAGSARAPSSLPAGWLTGLATKNGRERAGSGGSRDFSRAALR